MTLKAMQENYVSQLAHLYDPAEAGELFSIALQHISGIGKAQWALRKNDFLTASEEASLLTISDDLKAGKPLQYVLGDTVFYGLRFKLSPAVLIPRPETEELVDWVLKDASYIPRTVIDIGTGSGCIPVSIKRHLPDTMVWAIDISNQALEMARHNAMLNKTEIKLIQADILDPDFALPNQKFDTIVSNPPYISISEKAAMHANVLQHEPHVALFVPDDDALVFYEKIADFARKHLEDKGKLFFEINEALGENVVELLDHKGFNSIELRKDMQGKDRMVKACII